MLVVHKYDRFSTNYLKNIINVQCFINIKEAIRDILSLKMATFMRASSASNLVLNYLESRWHFYRGEATIYSRIFSFNWTTAAILLL